MMITSKIAETVTMAYCALELRRKIVGVTFLDNKEEFQCAAAPALRNKMPYCVLVKLAMAGYSRKANVDNFGCLSAARAFGIVKPTEEWLSGCQYRDRGMYRDLAIAKKVVDHTTNLSRQRYGVMVNPLEECTLPPDVVIIVSVPYNIMRLLQGYTYTYATYTNFKIIGNQAFCSECTAYPLESANINISTLCSGTRYMAGWGKDEMALGIPFVQFTGMIEGLYRTANPMEPNCEKVIIAEKVKKSGRTDLDIEYNKNYYTGLYNK